MNKSEVVDFLAARGQSVALYEANLPPIMRLMHVTKVEAAGWVQIKSGKYVLGNQVTNSQIEVFLPDWRNMVPVAKDAIAPFRQASFDLETYSPNDDKFPTAELEDNYIIQIATCMTDFGHEQNNYRFIYTLKDCDDINEPNTRLVRFQHESDMLLAWADLIANSDPDIVHAYNGWDFDYGYLAARAQLTGCWPEFRKRLTRFIEYQSNVIEKTLSSKAYGDNKWKLLTMPGRLVIDPMEYLKREHKLDLYNLKYVSEWFLSVKLKADPLNCIEGSRVVRVDHAKHGLTVGQVIKFSNIDTPDIVEQDGKSFYVFAGWSYEELHGDDMDFSGLHTVTNVVSADCYEFEMARPASKTVKGGGRNVKAFETKHDIDFPTMFRAWREQDTKILRDVGRYCIQDTLLPQKILDKLCILPNLIEMAKVTWVPIEFLITRGQQIKVFSQINNAAFEKGWAVPTVRKMKHVVNDEDDAADEEEGSGYVGGLVLEPFIDFYDEPIAVPDFRSLYPCTIIDGNYCLSTLIKDPKYDNLPGVQYNRVKVDEHRTNVFAMNYSGLIPEILVYLLKARDIRKRQMTEATTPLQYLIHNGAQLALKVSANSIYGFFGVSIEKAMLPCMPIAESTTASGRKGTYIAKDFAENIENFRDVMQCTTHFPLYYAYLMKNPKGKCFHMNAEKILKAARVSLDEKLPVVDPTDKNQTAWRHLLLQEPADPDTPVVAVPDGIGLQCWSTEEWSNIIGFSRVKRPYMGNEDLIRVHMDKGTTLDLNHYSVKTVDSPTAASSTENHTFCKVVYGDSVTGDTPVLIRYPDTNTLSYVNIEDLPFDDKGWLQYEGHLEKEYANLKSDIYVWSDKGFTKLQRVIRHKTQKDIYRVLTHAGVVKVTSDHSLLSPTGEELRPVDVNVGDELMHSELPATPQSSIDYLPCLFSMGFFMGDGSCGSYDCPSGQKVSWAINNTNLDLLNYAKEELDLVYGPDLSFHILDTIGSSGVYKLVPKGKGITKLVDEWHDLFYTKRKHKMVPDCILNAPVDVIKNFMEGFYAADGDKDDNGYYRFDQKGQIGAAGLLYLISQLRYKTSINVRSDKTDIYRVTGTKSYQQKNPRKIRRIENLGPTMDFVYDLQTDNHHFAAGVGKMIVHNTDSIFCLIGAKHLKKQAHKLVYAGIAAALISYRITQKLRSLNPFRNPKDQWMNLEYEKVYRFWIIFCKKRYVGEMTEFDPYHFDEDKKGVAQKRRDFCSFVKEVYSKILKAIFDDDERVTREERIQNALGVVRKAVDDLLNNRVPFEKLVVSKLLKDSYKVREKNKKKNPKKAAVADFGPHNIFVDDSITWKCQGCFCHGVVEVKNDVSAAAFFQGKKAKNQNDSALPLIAKVTKVEAIRIGKSIAANIRINSKMAVGYTDLLSRGASIMHLDKILNPNTTEKELEPITNAHVRLARKLYLRDPATAPKSGVRVPYVFCEPENPNVLQYMRAENPIYAKRHNLKVDPIYYLEKQCANAWGQILNTVCPGLVDKIFYDAYARYGMTKNNQGNIGTFFSSTTTAAVTSKHPVVLPKAAPKAAATPKKHAQSTLAGFFKAAPPKRERGDDSVNLQQQVQLKKNKQNN
jgi:DNA polymerase elongation subunit (family B)